MILIEMFTFCFINGQLDSDSGDDNPALFRKSWRIFELAETVIFLSMRWERKLTTESTEPTEGLGIKSSEAFLKYARVEIEY